jgi:hypothetical protein
MGLALNASKDVTALQPLAQGALGIQKLGARACWTTTPDMPSL